jgi:hypothetical protein
MKKQQQTAPIETGLPFSEISALSVKDACEKIRTTARKKLSDLKVFDLILDKDEHHGVYLFFSEEKKCLYVGKCGSRSFIERIPAHLVLDNEAWMNQFLKYLKTSKKLTALKVKEAVPLIRNYTLLFIPVKKWDLILPLEKTLKILLKPELNKYREGYMAKYKDLNLSESLGNLLKKI